MDLFGRKTGAALTAQLRDDETRAAQTSRDNAATARTTGKPVYGVTADEWDARAITFQNAADDYQRELDQNT